MFKKLAIILCALIFFARVAFSQKNREDIKYTVHFGKHNRNMPVAAENVVRIFIDADGNYYPDVFIRDRQLKDYSSLTEWYRNDTVSFNSICVKYNIPVGTFEWRLEQLNNAIANAAVTAINSKSKGYDIVNVYVHGFSKKAYGFRLIDRLARGDNRKLEHVMTRATDKKLFFVEVYWDSKFINIIKCAHKSKGYYVFKEQGIPAALHVGLSLRKLVAKIEISQLNIITHSSGATVASEILFNADTSAPPKQLSMATPMQPHIKVCMIAPAIGSIVFNNYYSRGGNVMLPQKDNYRLSIVYNTNDIVLNKKLHVLFNIINHTAAEIEPTTLGCDYKHDIHMLELKVAPNIVRSFDLSHKNRSARRCHYLVNCYIRNKTRFRDVVRYLEE